MVLYFWLCNFLSRISNRIKLAFMHFVQWAIFHVDDDMLCLFLKGFLAMCNFLIRFKRMTSFLHSEMGTLRLAIFPSAFLSTIFVLSGTCEGNLSRGIF